MTKSNCRFCQASLTHTFTDLGMSPLSNSYIKRESLQKEERFYPLHAYVCDKCFLVQVNEFEKPEEIFSEYAYFSSFSDSWLSHMKNYTEKVVSRFDFKKDSLVVEIASNDGYLLQFFKEKNINVLGIEPAKNVAKEAEKKGICSITEFFGETLAKKLKNGNKQADLLIGNNVLAHVPDLNDFVKGLEILLKPTGIITMEFPHLLRLMEENQFDTIYHEHFSYFSFQTVSKIFSHHGLTIFDVEELPTHGGSLRIYAKHTENLSYEVSLNVKKLFDREKLAGLENLKTYMNFENKVKKIKRGILNFLINLKDQNQTIVAYGAPAKGNTLLNYCGVGTDFLEYTVDKNTYKQGLFLPGSHIPIYDPEMIKRTEPDYIVILPWNIKEEITEQLAYARKWGAKFITLIPEIKVY